MRVDFGWKNGLVMWASGSRTCRISFHMTTMKLARSGIDSMGAIHSETRTDFYYCVLFFGRKCTVARF